MENPWCKIELADYEKHMSAQSVMQMQALDEITKAQIESYHIKSACILGIAGGNGLSHARKLEKIYCIDINKAYLDICEARFKDLGDKLALIQADLSKSDTKLPECGMVIANLLVEYIGINIFAELLEKTKPKYVSCVIQKSGGVGFVSKSGYEDKLASLDALHEEIDETTLDCELKKIGYSQIFKESIELPNSKSLLRLDFENTKRY